MKINRFLHVNNTDSAPARGQPGFDPLLKIRNIIDHLPVLFGSCLKPQRELSVDEAMIPFRGRLNFKQYVPAKPTKWGIKVWMLCESQSGYCLDFDIYTGRYTEVSENGLGYDVVRELTLPYQNRHYHIYFDRFFTSPLIVAELLPNHTYACGTVMLHRKGLPAEVKKRKVHKNAMINYQKED